MELLQIALKTQEALKNYDNSTIGRSAKKFKNNCKNVTNDSAKNVQLTTFFTTWTNEELKEMVESVKSYEKSP